jgi:hypothetical protein
MCRLLPKDTSKATKITWKWHGDVVAGASGRRHCLGLVVCSKPEEGDDWSWVERATWPGRSNHCWASVDGNIKINHDG